MVKQKDSQANLSNLLHTMLPGIEDSYARKLIRSCESKKSIPQLKKDISSIQTKLGAFSKGTGTITAKVLLDEITLSAAARQLRIHKNLNTISELGQVLGLSSYAVKQLSRVYGSFSSHLYFDTELEQSLQKTENQNLHPYQKAQQAVHVLLDKAETQVSSCQEIIYNNKKSILKTADKFHLSFKITSELIRLYTQPAAVDFQTEFDKHFQSLEKSLSAHLRASLAARIMLCEITPKDAQAIAQLQRLLNRDIMEEDLLTISYRYLRKKSPQDISTAFETVLRKLPYLNDPNENLGLAVKVLLEGTQTGLQRACETASLRREQEILRAALSKNTLFQGYEAALSQKFGGKKDFAQLEEEVQTLLHDLPYCQTPADNKELACKILLGSLSLKEAAQQAAYVRDVKASSLTQGLSPELIKNYTGEKSATNLIHFFKTALTPYTFWRTDKEKHLFALNTLVGELNGNYNSRVSQFVLNMLEKGASTESMSSLLQNLQKTRKTPKEVEQLLSRYQQKEGRP